LAGAKEHGIYAGDLGHGPLREVAVEDGGVTEHVIHVRSLGQIGRIGGGNVKIGAAPEVTSSVAEAEAGSPLCDLEERYTFRYAQSKNAGKPHANTFSIFSLSPSLLKLRRGRRVTRAKEKELVCAHACV
jgi:hypothetical protein